MEKRNPRKDVKKPSQKKPLPLMSRLRMSMGAEITNYNNLIKKAKTPNVRKALLEKRETALQNIWQEKLLEAVKTRNDEINMLTKALGTGKTEETAEVEK